MSKKKNRALRFFKGMGRFFKRLGLAIVGKDHSNIKKIVMKKIVPKIQARVNAGAIDKQVDKAIEIATEEALERFL